MDLLATVTRAEELGNTVRATRATSARLRHLAASVRRRIRFDIGGASDATITDAEVRVRLRVLFDGGALPRRVPRTLSAGRSEGRGRCAACDVHFLLGDIEYEVDMGESPMPMVHRRCLELWADEVWDGHR
jgi:hypothetical protein